MQIVIGALGVYLFVLLCWCLYISVMAFKIRRDTLHWAVKANAYVVLLVGLALDLILAWVVGPVIFLSLPRELTLTSALKRHRAGGGWRSREAAWICDRMLNPFVVDGHC
jgi:hypothetical protein